MGAALGTRLNYWGAILHERPDSADNEASTLDKIIQLLSLQLKHFDIFTWTLERCRRYEVNWDATRLRPVGVQFLQFLSHVGELLLVTSSNCPLQISGQAGSDVLCGELAGVTRSSNEHELVLPRSVGHSEIETRQLRWVSDELFAEGVRKVQVIELATKTWSVTSEKRTEAEKLSRF